MLGGWSLFEGISKWRTCSIWLYLAVRGFEMDLCFHSLDEVGWQFKQKSLYVQFCPFINGH